MSHDIEHEPLPPPRFTPARATLWMLGASIVMVMGLLMLLSMSPDSKNDHVSLGAVSAAVFLAVSASLVGRYPAGPQLSHALGWRATHVLAIPLGLLIGVCAQVPAEALAQFIEKMAPLSETEQAARAALFLDVSTVRAFGLTVVLVGLVPLAEECFFRGAVFGALRRDGSSPNVAATVAGIGFVLCHFNLRLLLPIALVAALLGILRVVSGSLLPSLAGHAAFNGVTVVSGVTKWEPPAFGTVEQALITLVLIALVASFVFLVGRSPVALRNRADDETVFPSELVDD